MRGFGFFLGERRNAPIRLANPRPEERRYIAETGNAALDGYTVLSRANPEAQGNPPPVPGVIGPVFLGPDQSFEQ